jgi:hypothetical protein
MAYAAHAVASALHGSQANVPNKSHECGNAAPIPF